MGGLMVRHLHPYRTDHWCIGQCHWFATRTEVRHDRRRHKSRKMEKHGGSNRLPRPR